MKEFDVALKAVAEGLRTIAQGMEKIAEKLEDSAPKKQAKAKPARKTAAKPKKAPAKRAAKKTAADTVFTVIKRSKKGVNNATLVKKTGFDKKKIANIIFKLRKQGKIKSIDRGIYTKT
jgi:predicted Rossmann fold nucleotide-binding protein DprA/Smf involved in DNA uptake